MEKCLRYIGDFRQETISPTSFTNITTAQFYTYFQKYYFTNILFINIAALQEMHVGESSLFIKWATQYFIPLIDWKNSV